MMLGHLSDLSDLPETEAMSSSPRAPMSDRRRSIEVQAIPTEYELADLFSIGRQIQSRLDGLVALGLVEVRTDVPGWTAPAYFHRHNRADRKTASGPRGEELWFNSGCAR
jgi:hypothetical protein